MRLTHIRVRHFQCIESAELELGPGLNVLYGPNDLGKSSLAAAVRAALLLQHGRAASEAFVPWHLDAVPEVEVVLCADDGRHYRVRKKFSSGSKGASTLEVSNDGVSFTNEGKGREVDEKLRTLLGWGLDSPGGRGGQGMPESFLTQVLLAKQTDVPAILARSLADDPAAAGRERLNVALAALAEDPVFKKVLDKAEGKVAEAYTPTGKRKGGAASPFAPHKTKLQQLQTDLDDLRKKDAATQDITRALQDAVNARDGLAAKEYERGEALKSAELRLAQAHARRQAEQSLQDSRAVLAGMRAKHDEVEALNRTSLERGQKCAELAASTRALEAAVEAREQALEVAEEAVREAQSEDGEQKRALALEKLDNEILQHEAGSHQAAEREGRARNALETQRSARDAQAALAACEAACEQAEKEQAQADKTQAEASAQQRALTLLERCAELRKAQGAWRKAQDAVDDATQLERAALQRKQELAAAAKARDALLVPSASEVGRLQQLWQALEVAEARLGGGLSVALRLRQALQVAAEVDGQPAEATERAGEWHFDAQRSLRLKLGEFGDLTVTAGEAESRATADTLHAQWEAEGVPTLAAASVTDVAALVAQRELASAHERARDEARQTADNLEQRAKEQRAGAGDLKALEAEVERCSKDVPAESQAELQRQLEGLGSAWRARLDEQASTLAERRQRAVIARQTAGEKLAEGRGRLGGAVQAQQQAATVAAEALAAIQGVEPEGELAAAQARRTQAQDAVSRCQAQRALLAQAGKAETEQAKAALARAKDELEKATTHLREGEAVEASEREAFVSHRAVFEERQRLLAALDTGAVQKEVEARQHALEGFPVPAGEPSEQEVTAARQALEQSRGDLELKRDEITKLEGRLEESGGEAVAERLRETVEAMKLAEAQQDALDVDYKAWRLLVDTLRESENSAGAHLGKRLAEPVTRRFQQLTGQRYGDLEVDPNLAATGLRVRGGARDIGALSVGTQDQLATLFRLCVAEELKSALILDDHLAQSDSTRIGWFSGTLRKAAQHIQIVVLTCRPGDYLRDEERPTAGASSTTRAAGLLKVMDLERIIKRDHPSLEPGARQPTMSEPAQPASES